MKKTKNNFFSFLSLFILILCVLSWNFWYENIKIFFNFSKDNSVLNYNKALFLAKNSDFSGALDSLPNYLEKFESKRLELEGDILYKLEKSDLEVLEKYKSSQAIENNFILDAKIKFLENKIDSQNNDSTEVVDKNKNDSETKNFDEDLKKILEDQDSRSKYINSYRNLESRYTSEIVKLKNSISQNNFYEQKDW